MAEFMLKNKTKEIYCESRATSLEEVGKDIYRPAKETLLKHHIPFTDHISKRVTKQDYDYFDEIYVMDYFNLKNINRIVDDVDKKIKLLCDYEIDDPWYTGAFEEVYKQIDEGLERIINDI